MVEALSKSSSIEITLQFLPAEFPRLPLEIETAIFRITQEGLANVYRHSRSAKAELEVEKQPVRVCAQGRDYGKGIASDMEEKTDVRDRHRRYAGTRPPTQRRPLNS